MSTQGLIEISLSGLDDEATPSVISLFDEWGRGGAVVEQAPGKEGATTIKTYLLPEDDKSLRQIEIGLALLDQALHTPTPGDSSSPHPIPEPHIRFLSEKDWAEAWKAHYDVLRVGRRLVIKPTWCDYDPTPGDLIIELDPGMAFGSGLHPTTRLCLEALEDYLRPGTSVLDMGTGSGILAIAAARLGASQVLAVDTDPLAVRVAGENVALNGVGAVVGVEVGTAEISNGKYQMANGKYQMANGKYQMANGKWQMANGKWQMANGKSANQQTSLSPGWDLVVANILAETIVELMPGLVGHLAAEGTLIVSGIIADRAEAVVDALHEHGLSPVERQDEGDWVALVANNE